MINAEARIVLEILVRTDEKQAYQTGIFCKLIKSCTQLLIEKQLS